MSFVTVEQFVATNTALEQRLGVFESRLNDLFTKVDTRFAEHSGQFMETNGKLGIINGQMQNNSGQINRMGSDLPAQMRALLDESKILTMDKAAQMEHLRQQTTDAFTSLNQQLAAMQADVVGIGQTSSGSGTGSSHERGLINPKDFALKVYDGEQSSKMHWEEWREDLEDFIDSVRPLCKMVLEKCSRWPDEIHQNNFANVLNAAGIHHSQLSWTFEKLDKDLYTYIKKFLSGKARKAFKSKQFG